ncbi:MAG: cob(I)yrinic acid a,c-diamide adenosyltransferase [Desulfococcaceae bacterium]
MKIYTRGGDQGKTSLFSGERVPKSHERVEAYGEMDELSSVLGALAASLPENQENSAEEIRQIQSDLLQAGALLSTSPDSSSFRSLKPFDPEQSRWLENAIDRMDAVLPPLKSFILPGGEISAAWAHIARTVCRRAERRIIGLTVSASGADTEKMLEYLQSVIAYVNRLSDYLFVLARWCNHIADRPDISWKK